MADLSHLNLTTSEPLDLAIYNDAGGSSMPPKGRYTVRAPESFPSTAFGQTKAGNLSASIDPTIVGGKHDGYNIRYQKISAKVFKRGGTPASQFGDYLRACGLKTGALNGDPVQLASLVEQTANSTYQVDLDWRAFDKDTGQETEGMESFPKREDGTYQPWLESKTSKDENGDPVRVKARLFIARFVAAG